jgi:hypothetical protein
MGAGAAAAAAMSVLAAAAATAEEVGVAEGAEERVLAVHADEVVGADVAGGEREEPARADGAEVVDEEEAVAVGHGAAGAADAADLRRVTGRLTERGGTGVLRSS